MPVAMNYYSLNSSLPSSPPPSAPSIPHFIFPIWQIPHHHHPHHSTASCSLRRHHRRRRTAGNPNQPKPFSSPSPSSDQKLQMVIDIDHLSNSAPLSVRRLFSSSKLKVNEFVHSGNEALEDLRTLIAVDADRRVVLSCRPSTVRFMGGLAVWSFVSLFALRILVKLGLGFWGKLGFGSNSGLVVVRRDRSLGGREVVVARERNNANSSIRVLKNPLVSAQGTGEKSWKGMLKGGVRRREEKKKLPSWWPVLLPPPVVTADKEQYQRMANRFIRAIMDYRISGKDISEDDVIQFRRLCRASGARVAIDTTNARDSFYRTSVDFVFNICGRVDNQCASVDIDGEDARQFIAGLADNIGLENTRAARIVSAAVAARTRSCFLQVWALEMQGKHSEAVVELSKIRLIHEIFPPEECSPEMEMVARGLENHLKLEQRKFLMDMLVGACGVRSHRSMAEALGLVHSPEDVCNEQESKFT